MMCRDIKSILLYLLNRIMGKLIILALLVCCSVCKFDADLAKILFELNVATYCRPSTVKDWSCKPCGSSTIQLK